MLSASLNKTIPSFLIYVFSDESMVEAHSAFLNLHVFNEAAFCGCDSDIIKRQGRISSAVFYRYNRNPFVVNIVSKIVFFILRARCSSMVRAFAHGAVCHRIDPS